jgi:hypothetical protein
MFRPDETAFDYFKRMKRDMTVDLDLDGKSETLQMGNMVEIITRSIKDDAKTMQSLTSQLTRQYRDIHITVLALGIYIFICVYIYLCGIC